MFDSIFVCVKKILIRFSINLEKKSKQLIMDVFGWALSVAAAGSWFDLPQPRQQVPLNMAIIFWNLKSFDVKIYFLPKHWSIMIFW